MVYSVLYLILAALGLGILVFIHEFGHYWVALREKMVVEAFSIGFGRAIKTWERKGVKWQIGWIPFGGYVRIAGMDKKGNLEPHEVEGGFYSKTPAARIRVLLAGPIVNIVFSFLIFCCIWMFGGREKPFAEYTKHIGWVQTPSTVSEAGVKAGDEILKYGGKPFQGFGSLLSTSVLESGAPTISGCKIDYFRGIKTPFSCTLEEEAGLEGLDKYRSLVSMIHPAAYLLYRPDRLMESSPVKESGIQEGDRIIWVDGELVFSRKELSDIINDSKALLTIARGNQIFFTKVPRLHIQDIRMTKEEKGELQDWAHACQSPGCFSGLYFIPYTVNFTAEVETPVAYIDARAKKQDQFMGEASTLAIPLQPGDRILSVDGQNIQSGKDLFWALQKRQVQMIVQRGVSYSAVDWQIADADFMTDISFADLSKLISALQNLQGVANVGNLYLLRPIEPKPLSLLPLSGLVQQQREDALSQQRKQIEQIKNPKEKLRAIQQLDLDLKRLFIGGLFEDRKVLYNPSPVQMFVGVIEETWKTLKALCTGYLSPKYIAGPIGIVGALQHGWTLGIKEALFWLAVVSVNLGFVNLLPIPAMDGGHICFALYEAITKKKIKAKTMEKWLFPFLILLVLFFIYFTYQDIMRVLSRFF